VCESSAAIVAEAQLSSARPGAPARLVLDLGDAHPAAAALARDLARGVLGQIEALLADPATDLPTQLRDVVAVLAEALAEQSLDEATVTALDTPLVRARRAHPAGRGR
jgi:hypothetical protein